jgi:hypothetical protein
MVLCFFCSRFIPRLKSEGIQGILKYDLCVKRQIQNIYAEDFYRKIAIEKISVPVVFERGGRHAGKRDNADENNKP